MKEKREVEVYICDACGKQEDYATECTSCGKHYCFDCAKTHMKRYNHAVHFQGSSDGENCHDCDKKLRENGDPKHAAYRKIDTLKQEQKAWWEDFDIRAKKAEAELKELQS